MRHSFGGDLTAWAFTAGAGNTAVLVSNAEVTFWTAQSGGTQITDLSEDPDGEDPLGQVTTGDGAESPVGDIPLFYGPDGVLSMWASAAEGPRRLILANNFFDIMVTAESDGSVRPPNLGHTLTWTVAGALTVATGAFRIYNDTGVALVIRAIRASVGTAPTGADLIVDVNKNGTTVFTTQPNRPTVAAGTNTAKVTNMDVTALANGDYLTVDIDQIGSTVAGSNLVVQVLAY